MVLASNTVALVTYCVTKMVTTCSSMVEQFFDTMIVASSDKQCYNDPSKYKCWKLFRATLNKNNKRSAKGIMANTSLREHSGTGNKW